MKKEEILEFLRKCFPTQGHYGKEREIIFEIFPDELEHNFLTQAFGQDFEWGQEMFSIKGHDVYNGDTKPIFKSIIVAGVYNLKLKVRYEKD